MLTPAMIRKLIGDAKVPGNFRLFLDALDRLAQGHAECWCGNERLGAEVGCCERTVRNLLALAKSFKLIRVVRDYTLNSRRRIRLLWKQATHFIAPVTANMSPDSGATFAASPAVPPDPPIAVPEGKCAAEIDGGAPPPREDLVPLVARARKIAPDCPGLAGRVAALLKRWGRDWLRAALDRAEERRKAEPIRNLGGYLRNTLRGFEEDGGPPPPPPTEAELAARQEAERAARIARATAGMKALRAARRAEEAARRASGVPL